MKSNSNIVILFFSMVAIFLFVDFPNYSWSALYNYPQQKKNKNDYQDSILKPSLSSDNDSTSIVYCDKISPHFENLDPLPGQNWVDRNSPIKFSVVDGSYKWESAGIDTETIAISIVTSPPTCR